MAEGLLDELGDGWLRDQVLGLRTFTAVLAGESMSLAYEAAGSYGVRPEHTEESKFVAAHERLERVLIGSGPLPEKYRRWEEAMKVPSDKLEQTLVRAIETARRLTRRIVDLPEGEEVAVDTARDVRWMAFCKYLGNLKSRVSVNVDRPLSAVELLTVATHEAYPGHHTEHSCKEQLLVRERSMVEETIRLSPTPQSLISEGIGRMASARLLDSVDGSDLEAVVRDAGVDFDLAHAREVQRAYEVCSGAIVNAALELDERTLSQEGAAEYLQRWALVAPEIATRLIQYLVDPTSRTYVFTYLAGQELCESYVGDDPARFSNLLTCQRT